MTDTPLNPTAVALQAIAQAMQAELLVVPHSIDIWFHDLPRKTFMSMADGLEKPVTIYEPSPTSPLGHAGVQSNFPTERGAARITMHYLCGDLSVQARGDYATHNAECVTDAPGAVHPTILDDQTRTGATK
jgi:hypothetical protein